MEHADGPWRRAVEVFLADLTDTSAHSRALRSTATSATGDDRPIGTDHIPPELDDLHEAAARVLARITPTDTASPTRYPSIDRAVHEIVIAEVIADRLERRSETAVDLDALVQTTAATLDYFAELAATRIEGTPVTHGVVITTNTDRLGSIETNIVYPGHLPTRKRTPLLFDGTQSTLLVGATGRVLHGVDRTTLPTTSATTASLEAFDELPGIDGGLTAAASAAYSGIGIYLRSDRTILIFDNGTLLFIRRSLRWRSIGFESFTRTLTTLGNTSPMVGQRIARAALRLAMQGHGAILAICSESAALAAVTERKDRTPPGATASTGDVDDDLARMLHLPDVASAAGLVRLARLDGATIVGVDGHVLAYGAIVRTTASQGEGARAAAARTLSTAVDVAISISHDGPITVYHAGNPHMELL
jgi:hypothetical protein